MMRGGFRGSVAVGLVAALVGCGAGGKGGGDASASETLTASADSGGARAAGLDPGVTVDTQKIEDSTVAEMYVAEDSAGGH